MNRGSRNDSRYQVRIDPRYASARPWDWRLCQDCQTLVPLRCPKCGSARLSGRPGHIIRAGLRQFGPPPALFKA